MESNNEPHRSSRLSRWVLAILLFSPLIYIVSIGPMSPILRFHCGDSGYQVWQAVYGAPLGRTPRPIRNLVNKYLGFSDMLYWRMRKG